MSFRVKTMIIERQKESSIDLKNVFDLSCFFCLHLLTMRQLLISSK